MDRSSIWEMSNSYYVYLARRPADRLALAPRGTACSWRPTWLGLTGTLNPSGAPGQVIRENPASRGTETSAEDLVGAPRRWSVRPKRSVLRMLANYAPYAPGRREEYMRAERGRTARRAVIR